MNATDRSEQRSSALGVDSPFRGEHSDLASFDSDAPPSPFEVELHRGSRRG
ncbi:MAG TPA: hypothetical protein VL068_12255 [Microthrixaceae bacterium]|nr:hypothetical protein [Microthrixaceae bacterium]